GGDLATDAQGNVIAAGVVDDTGDQPNLYVVKYAVDDGRVLWERLVDTPSFSEVQGGLAVDAAGNVYVGMRFSGFGTTTIGGTTVTADLFGNIVVLRLAAATGAIEWVKQWGGDGQDKP